MDSTSRARTIEMKQTAMNAGSQMKFPSLVRGFVGSNGFLLLLIVLGMLLRVWVYMDNRPFWTDEAQLALNIRSKGVFQLFGHLDFCQAAPPLFLAAIKILARELGDNEVVLRIVPFVAGIFSLPLFVLLAKRTVRSAAVPLAVTMFAISEPLIRYTSELKQYSVDVLSALLLWLLASAVFSDKKRGRGLLGLALIGSASPWFSFASILVLIAIAITGLARAGIQRNSREGLLWCSIAGLWIISIGSVCTISLSSLVASSARAALMDQRAVVPHDMSAISWLLSKGFDILQFPVGVTELGTGVAVIVSLLGFIQVIRRRKFLALSISLPILLALIGSCLSLYPFFGRFLLFAVPACQLMIAEGVVSMPIRIYPGSSLIRAVAIVLLLLPRFDLLDRDEHGINRHWTNVRGALEYIQEHRRPNDIIYVYYGAYFPTMYYCRQAGIKEQELLIGVPGYWWNNDLRKTLLAAWQKSGWGSATPPEEVFHAYSCGEFSQQWHVYESDLQRLVGHPRVWALFSLTNWCGSDEEKVFRYFLDKRGIKLDAYKSPGASVYLYNLGQKPSSSGRESKLIGIR